MRTRITLPIVTLLLAAALAACVPPAPAAPTPAPTQAPTETPQGAATPAATSTNQQPVPTPPADGSRPLAAIPPAERADRFSEAAPMWIDPAATYVATIVTSKGNIVAELYGDTPESANNFVTLALDGFYDGLTFHRVEPGFVIQGGDPVGTGAGSPGYTIPAEINHTHARGALAWARTSDEVNPERRSSGSQFYITLAPTPFLNGAYTVFGQVIEGMDVVDQIAVGDTIERIDITKSQTSRMPTPTPIPEPKAPTPEEGRPLAKVPLAERENYYNTAPAMVIDASKSYQATIKTAKGDIVVDLDGGTAPATLNNFIVLANLGYYDGLPVAYTQPGSFLVMGSPSSQPSSGVGYTLTAEPGIETTQIVTGTIGMYPVVSADGTMQISGSQFFIALGMLPPGGTPLNIFGQVSSGLDVAAELQAGDVVESIIITEK